MVTFPPLLPSSDWMASFLDALTREKDFDFAISSANNSLPTPREFARYQILDSRGDHLTLSVAVEGGGRQLRDFSKIQNLFLSEHGDWRRNHLRALEACLGKKPYFPYLFPDLNLIYLDKELKTLKDFNFRLFEFLLTFLLADIPLSQIARFHSDEVLQERGLEIASQIPRGISSFEAVAIHGKEALLGFLAINDM